ncbi:MAG: BlaI/MecI/CopY family transcriptional regulator [Nitrososphaeria archaeon]|nr:BlaI/MecI/CopY family transcriptional regulator [Conexivisphaerales archaeon]
MKKSGLGPLEIKILSALSELKEGTVKQVYSELQKSEENLAITTVATVLDRLFKKRIVERTLINDGKPSYVYRISSNIFKNEKAMSLVIDFLKAFKEPLKFYFAENSNLTPEELESIFKALEE